MEAIALALLFLLGRELAASLWPGLLAALVLLADPLLVRSSRSVMMDVPALFFSLLALWGGAQLCRRIQEPDASATTGMTLATGLACGLALATKMNTLLVLGVVLLWVWVSAPRLNARTLATLVGLALLPALVFVATNPFLYRAPIEGTLHILELGALVAQYDVTHFQQLRDWPDRIAALVHVGITTSASLGRLTGLGGWLDGALCALGGGVLLVHAWARHRGAVLTLVYLAVTTAGILWWTPYVWRRWYLPMEPLWALLEALGVAALAGAAARLRGAAKP